MKIPLTQRNNTQAKLYIEKPNSSGNINRFYISDVVYSYEPTDTISRFGNAQRVTPEGLLIFVFNDKKISLLKFLWNGSADERSTRSSST